MSGSLALAGLHPDRTPLDAWVAAIWAALVNFMSSGVPMDALDRMWKPFSSTTGEHGEPDRDTWGLLPEHVAGQQPLLENGW